MKSSLQLTTLAVVLFVAFVFVPTSAVAQFRAGIQGTVVDAAGGLIPDATVTITSQETNVTRSVNTGPDGVFTIPNLGPGRYRVSVEKVGFSTKVLTDVVISAEQMQSLNVQLDVGETATTINVDETVAAVVDTQTANISGTLTTRDIQNLPSFARDPYQLLRLAPGVFGDGALSGGGGSASLPGTNIGAPSATSSIFSVENGVQVIANGTRQNSNNFQVDGVSVNSTSWGGAAVITPNEESVKEVRIIANNYTAENGRTSGAQVMVVSQNGTNQLHGSAFFKWHRPGLNSYQRWNGPGSPSPVTKDTNRFNQFGGSLGGPFWKNKLFGFFSYETLRNNSFSQGTGWYQTSEFMQNAGAANTIARQLLTFPGMAPSFVQRIGRTCADVGLPSTQCRDVAGGLDIGSPIANAARGTRDPSFNGTGTPIGIGGGFDGVPDIMYLQTRSPNLNTSAQYNGRVDFTPTQTDQFAFSIYWVPVDTFFYNGPARPANEFNHNQLSRSWTVIYTRTFSPSLLNEARFGLTGWRWNEFESNPQAAWGLPTASFTDVGGIGVQSLGAPGFSIFDQKTYNFRDTLTKVHGTHQLKFGADVSRAQFLDTAPWSARPNYEFRNLWDFANDAPYRESANFDPVTGQPSAVEKNLRFNILGFFAQDDWKVRPNLSLNFGVRWEYFSPLTETKGNLSNVILGSGGDPLAGLRIRKGGNLFETSKNNWGPQIGFAWSPTQLIGRKFNNNPLVFRGGFGVGYNLQQLAITSNGRFNPPFMVALSLFDPNIVYAPNANLKSFTGWPSNPAAVQQFDANTGLPTSGAPLDLTGYPDKMPSTVTYRYSLDMQYAFTQSWMAMIGYQGSQSRHYTIQDNLNYLLYPSLNPRVRNLYWFSNYANAHYNALLTQVQHRVSGTFQLDAQYRFSRNTDIGSQDYFMSRYPWNRKYDLGPSDFDVTHLFKLWGMWTPRIGAQQSWLNRIAGNWTISGILTMHSGFPWTPLYCNTANSVVYANSGFGCLYPSSYKGGATEDYGNSTFQRFNGNFPQGALAYFTLPTWPSAGIPAPPADNIHRNMFRGPRFIGNDFTFAKAFGIPGNRVLGENARLNLQANVYNLFNRLNLTGMNGNISNDGLTSNPQFGTAQGAFSGRIIELQARFSF